MKWSGRIKFNRIAKIAAAISVFIVVVMASFTFIGANGANFVVKFDGDDGLGLALYNTEAMDKPLSRLSYPTLIDQKDVSLSWIPENIEDGLGDKSDMNRSWYFAFSFLLRNESNVPADISLEINAKKVTKNVDSAVRVALYRSVIGSDEPSVRRIFAKPKSIEDKVVVPEITKDYNGNILYESEPFLSPTKICSLRYDKLKIGEVNKFTVLIWIEGYDPECKDELKGGTMSMDMSIKIV